MLTLLACLALRQDSPVVSFEHRAAPIRVVLKTLADVVHTPLSAEKAFDNTNLLVSFTNVTPEVALAKVADATDGEWHDMNGGKTLFPNTVVRKKRDDEATAKVKAEFDKAVKKAAGLTAYTSTEAAKVVQEAAKQVGQDNGMWDYKAYEENLEKGPARRTMYRVLAAIGSAELMAVSTQKRVVWSTAPTRMQRAFPAGVAEALKTYVSEVKALNEAVNQYAPARQEGGVYNPLLYQSYLPEGALKGALLVGKSGESSPGWSFTLKVFFDGSDHDVDNWSFDPTGLSRPAGTPKETLTGLEGKAEFSGFSQRAMEALTRSFGVRGTSVDPETSAWIRNELSHLDQSELMTSSVSDVVLQAVHQKKLNAAMSIPDLMLAALAMGRDLKPTLQNAWNQVFGLGVMDYSLTDGWVTAKLVTGLPFDVAVDRASIASLCQRIQKGGVTVEALADYATQAKDPMSAMFGTVIASLGYPRLRNTMMMGDAFYALRIYGRLDAPARREAANGGYKSPFSTLPPASQADLRSLVYEVRDGLESTSTARDARAAVPSSPGNWESTSLLPNGFPAGTTVTVVRETLSSLFKQTSFEGGWNDLQEADPQNQAYEIAWAERGLNGGPRQLLFGNGKLDLVRVSAQFAPALFQNAGYKLLPEFDPKELVTWDKLPEDQKSVIQSKLEEARKAYQGVTAPQPPRIKP